MQHQDETTAVEAATGRRSRSRRSRRNVAGQPQTVVAGPEENMRTRRERKTIDAPSELAQEKAAMARVSTGTSVEDEDLISEDEDLASLIEELESELPEPDVNLMSRYECYTGLGIDLTLTHFL